MEELTWRSLRPEDAAAGAELMAAAEAVDQTGEHYSGEDLEQEMRDESLDLAADTWAVLDASRLVGYGAVHGQTQVWDVGTVGCHGVVHPDYRGRGIGRRLLAEQLARAEALHAERHPGVPARITVGVYDHDESAKALVKAAGLTASRQFFDMERDLRTDAPAPWAARPPLRIVPFETARDEEVRRAHNVAFREHYASTERNPASWKQWFTGSRNFRAELSFLALDGRGEDAAVAAYLLGYFYTADEAATGRREAWIGQLGTLPAWRGRGAGSALLAHALSAYRAAGYQQAGLDVDSANGSGALGLYERVGFRVTHSVTSWERQVAAQPAG